MKNLPLLYTLLVVLLAGCSTVASIRDARPTTRLSLHGDSLTAGVSLAYVDSVQAARSWRLDSDLHLYRRDDTTVCVAAVLRYNGVAMDLPVGCLDVRELLKRLALAAGTPAGGAP